MRRATFHGPVRRLAFEQSEDQAGGKRIAATDAVIDFEVLTSWGLVELAVVVAYGSPIVHRRSLRVAECRGHHQELGKIINDVFDHFLETRNLQLGVVLVDISDGEAESG